MSRFSIYLLTAFIILVNSFTLFSQEIRITDSNQYPNPRIDVKSCDEVYLEVWAEDLSSLQGELSYLSFELVFENDWGININDIFANVIPNNGFITPTGRDDVIRYIFDPRNAPSASICPLDDRLPLFSFSFEIPLSAGNSSAQFYLGAKRAYSGSDCLDYRTYEDFDDTYARTTIKVEPPFEVNLDALYLDISNDCKIRAFTEGIYDFCNSAFGKCCPGGIEKLSYRLVLYKNGKNPLESGAINSPNFKCKFTNVNTPGLNMCTLKVGDTLHFTLQFRNVDFSCDIPTPNVLNQTFTSKTFIVKQEDLDACCSQPKCDSPTDLSCTIDGETIKFSWSAIPQATQYRVTLRFNDPECCENDNKLTPHELTRKADRRYFIFTPGPTIKCFSLTVAALCDGVYSSESEKYCWSSEDNSCIPAPTEEEENSGLRISSPSDDNFGLGKHKDIQEVQLSPNPFTNDFQIQLSANSNTPYQLTIFNLQGQSVLNMEGQLTKGFNQLTIEQLSNIPAGIYQYQLITSQQKFGGKVIKQ